MSYPKVSRPVAIPDVKPDIDSMYRSMLMLKEGYENLSRQRGRNFTWPVTFQDLIDMGLITEADMNAQLQRRRV
jgi:hypothetical protein